MSGANLAYGSFAEIYDLLMDDIDYDAWADYYLRLLALSGLTPRTLCDCACGTGSMSVRFAKRGMRVTGVDISERMLAIGQEKGRAFGVQVMYVHQDMCCLTLPKQVDALICACDGVNYLLDDDRLRAFFRSAYLAIRPGGAFAFDVSSPWKLEHVLGDQFFGEDRDDVTYLWKNSYSTRERTVSMDLTFFVRRGDGLYRRFDEYHVQKAHEPAHLISLMAEQGFGEICTYGDLTLEPPAPQALRIHFIAKRQ